MRSKRWQLELAATLVLLATALYAARWLLFNSGALHNEMLRFLLGDMAFLFVQVLLVSFVLDRMIRGREHDEMLNKLNMIIGAFFSETGTDLLGQIARADARLADVRSQLIPGFNWKADDYERSRAAFGAHQPQIDLSSCDLEQLKHTLAGERTFLIGLLGNQNLLEHETFTDLLWALTHLGEELEARPDLGDLPRLDAAHIAGDVKRAYTLLGTEWLTYLSHLQSQYPHLFSLAVRTNPLDPEARVTVESCHCDPPLPALPSLSPSKPACGFQPPAAGYTP
jgi:hypothetical protein